MIGYLNNSHSTSTLPRRPILVLCCTGSVGPVNVLRFKVSPHAAHGLPPKNDGESTPRTAAEVPRAPLEPRAAHGPVQQAPGSVGHLGRAQPEGNRAGAEGGLSIFSAQREARAPRTTPPPIVNQKMKRLHFNILQGYYFGSTESKDIIKINCTCSQTACARGSRPHRRLWWGGQVGRTGPLPTSHSVITQFPLVLRTLKLESRDSPFTGQRFMPFKIIKLLFDLKKKVFSIL